MVFDLLLDTRALHIATQRPAQNSGCYSQMRLEHLDNTIILALSSFQLSHTLLIIHILFLAQVPEIESIIETILNCISLLLPPPEEFFVADTSDANVGDDALAFSSNFANGTNEDDSFNLRQFGLSSSYNLVINIDHSKKVHIRRTEENSAIIDNLKENIIIAKKFRPVIKKWEDSLSRCLLGIDYISKVENLKNKLEGCLKKHTELQIESIEGESTDGDDDGCDMEEVVKEGYEPAVLPIFGDPGPSTSKIRKEVVNAGANGSAEEIHPIQVCRTPWPSGKLCLREDRFRVLPYIYIIIILSTAGWCIL